mmetsp:Transcript_25877/g.63382  ORF Transcript_25877/g.63382 Transcript_25877/m.63382 type:complete len:205 (+) Transcript_25877:2943-3557(+)
MIACPQRATSSLHWIGRASLSDRRTIGNAFHGWLWQLNHLRRVTRIPKGLSFSAGQPPPHHDMGSSGVGCLPNFLHGGIAVGSAVSQRTIILESDIVPINLRIQKGGPVTRWTDEVSMTVLQTCRGHTIVLVCRQEISGVGPFQEIEAFFFFGWVSCGSTIWYTAIVERDRLTIVHPIGWFLEGLRQDLLILVPLQAKGYTKGW